MDALSRNLLLKILMDSLEPNTYIYLSFVKFEYFSCNCWRTIMVLLINFHELDCLLFVK
jgi:hypothetical protein